MENKISSDQLFMGLVYSLTQSVFIALGKLPDPMSGKIERSLEQASQTIDLLAALMEKTKGNLKEEEESFLTHTVSELRLNYVDEVNKAKQQTATEAKPAEKESKPEEEKAKKAGAGNEKANADTKK
ncbi:MAG: DUF1844 domain-containing protein [Candidatus Neomarinimicrobiota bacterium]|jgi:hypothetical protein|nr:DUF1844 domain-containing protein [Candidatus Neomarinimicrobiota bacterium]MDD3965936.1 DUF1844 domain-containing protein [Candidatus Neomarinimicrobiota bacterium]MDX9781154.1 DUF1844 domain-containing protein [bacterium]